MMSRKKTCGASCRHRYFLATSGSGCPISGKRTLTLRAILEQTRLCRADIEEFLECPGCWSGDADGDVRYCAKDALQLADDLYGDAGRTSVRLPTSTLVDKRPVKTGAVVPLMSNFELKARGWSDTEMMLFLGNPDCVYSPHSWAGRYRYYSCSRIVSVERSQSFKVWREKMGGKRRKAVAGARTRSLNQQQAHKQIVADTVAYAGLPMDIAGAVECYFERVHATSGLSSGSDALAVARNLRTTLPKRLRADALDRIEQMYAGKIAKARLRGLCQQFRQAYDTALKTRPEFHWLHGRVPSALMECIAVRID
jgi:hypothetical protein